ncbi:hypothetical protein [Nocardioides sambongensis]|uniref:hypothetical protein n=1 Tax=Nocardioides sambongensis TaxID=2589074 RepID=UPI001E2D840A|nr:hypothetical protein [Nocardioides sambongensis]
MPARAGGPPVRGRRVCRPLLRRRAARRARAGGERGRIGVAVFKDDFRTIRSLAERDNKGIVHWSEFGRGGHFAAMEVPADVVADLRVFFS